MKIGCGEWGFRELPLEEHFRLCQQFGFKTMEFGIGGGQTGRLPDRMSSSQIKEFQELKMIYGIKTPFCCLENDFTLHDHGIHNKMVEKILGQITLASKLGAIKVRLFAGFTVIEKITEDIWQQLIAAFHTCSKLCNSLGIEISIETHGNITFKNGLAYHEHTVSTDRNSLIRLLRELPPQVGFNYDPGNLKAVDPQDKNLCIDLLNDRINYCHLKDWKQMPEGGWIACAPGDDDLDYKSLLSHMKYSGVYLIEYEPTNDIVDGIHRSLSYLTKCVDEIELP
jgi:sugar phosphate isomerase/epimerase